jgi:hypothetical protein
MGRRAGGSSGSHASLIRRIAAGVLFVALLAGGIRIPILRLLLPPHRPPDEAGPLGGVDRKPLRLKNDPTDPAVLQFFENIRSRTEPGDEIGLLMAWPHEGWSYTYWRGSYALAGRRVLPPLNDYESTDAGTVATWQKGFGDERYAIVWRDENGALLRRQR